MKSIRIFCTISLLFMGIVSLMAQALIQGTINNNKYDKVELKLAYGSENVVASAAIDAQGKFVMKPNVKSHDIYALTFAPDQKFLVVVAPGEKIALTINADNLQEIPSVSGSKSMQFSKDMIDLLLSQKSLVDNLNAQLQGDEMQLFFNEFYTQYQMYSQTNDEVDKAMFALWNAMDSLKLITNQSFKKSKPISGTIDFYLAEANRLLKSVENNYVVLENYKANVGDHYDMSKALNLQPTPQFGNEILSDFQSKLSNYQTLLQNRLQLAEQSFSAIYSQSIALNQLRDSLKFNGLVEKKNEKVEMAMRYYQFAQLYGETQQKEFTNYQSNVNQSRQLNAQILKNIQDNISAIVDHYRKLYSDAEAVRTAQLKDKILENKGDIAVLMFLDVFKRDQNVALHKDVVKTLAQNYPTHPLVQERVKIEASAPASTAVGVEAPELEFPNPEGKLMRLSDLRGKVVLIDFWASWCRPCRMENPNVVKLYNQYKDKGFDIFSVSLDSSHDSWVAAIAADKLTWPNHVSDLKKWGSAGAKLYGVNSIPCTYLIDRDGKILAKNLRGDALARALKEIFGE